MTETTARFAIPLLQAGQAQKEIAHNEAVVALELIAQPIAESFGAVSPPASPVEGRSWIVGEAPSGAWSGHPGALASWTAGGWRFAAPIEGMAVFVKDGGLVARRTASGWVSGPLAASELLIGGTRVVGPQRPAIPSPSGGATVDSEARAAVTAMLATLRAHGLIASA